MTIQKVITPETKAEVACIRCGFVSAAFFNFCPNCGRKLARKSLLRILGLVLFALVGAMIVLAAIGASA